MSILDKLDCKSELMAFEVVWIVYYDRINTTHSINDQHIVLHTIMFLTFFSIITFAGFFNSSRSWNRSKI